MYNCTPLLLTLNITGQPEGRQHPGQDPDARWGAPQRQPVTSSAAGP